MSFISIGGFFTDEKTSVLAKERDDAFSHDRVIVDNEYSIHRGLPFALQTKKSCINENAYVSPP